MSTHNICFYREIRKNFPTIIFVNYIHGGEGVQVVDGRKEVGTLEDLLRRIKDDNYWIISTPHPPPTHPDTHTHTPPPKKTYIYS